MTCETCKFWRFDRAVITRGPWRDYSSGECKRNAPIGISAAEAYYEAKWPRTASKDICGEYEEKAE